MARKGSAKWLREVNPELAESLIPLLSEVRDQVMSSLMGRYPQPESEALSQWKRAFAREKRQSST